MWPHQQYPLTLIGTVPHDKIPSNSVTVVTELAKAQRNSPLSQNNVDATVIPWPVFRLLECFPWRYSCSTVLHSPWKWSPNYPECSNPADSLIVPFFFSHHLPKIISYYNCPSVPSLHNFGCSLNFLTSFYAEVQRDKCRGLGFVLF